MRKIELVELVLDYLAGGDAPQEVKGKYHPEIIKNHLNTVFNRIVYETYMEGKLHSDYSVLDAWALNYTISITGVSTNTGNVLLPYPPMQLPNNMGILQVAPSTDLTNAFAYRETNANTVFAELEVSAVSTTPTFYLEKNSAVGVPTHVLKLEKIPSGCTAVLVKQIVPLEQLDDYEMIGVPAAKADRMVQYVIELLRGKPREDKINDGQVNQ